MVPAGALLYYDLAVQCFRKMSYCTVEFGSGVCSGAADVYLYFMEYIYIYICMYVRVYMYIYVCVCVCVCVCMYIYLLHASVV